MNDVIAQVRTWVRDRDDDLVAEFAAWVAQPSVSRTGEGMAAAAAHGAALLRRSGLTPAVVETAGAELIAHAFPRPVGLFASGLIGRSARDADDIRRIERFDAGRGGPRRQQQVEQPLLRRLVRLVLDLLASFGADHVHGQLDEVADHRFDVAADVAHFGELRRLDLDEGRLREARETPRDLGLADAGRSDHQNVLWGDFLGDLGGQPLAADAVAERDRHGAFGLALPDDVLIELGDDLARGQRCCGGCGAFGKKNGH